MHSKDCMTQLLAALLQRAEVQHTEGLHTERVL